MIDTVGWVARLAICLFILSLAGCAQHNRGNDDNRPGGFYGAVSGGLAQP